MAAEEPATEEAEEEFDPLVRDTLDKTIAIFLLECNTHNLEAIFDNAKDINDEVDT